MIKRKQKRTDIQKTMTKNDFQEKGSKIIVSNGEKMEREKRRKKETMRERERGKERGGERTRGRERNKLF